MYGKALETKRTTAKFMPDVAKVNAKEYTPDVSVISPIPSLPIVFDRKTLKITEIERKRILERDKIRALIKYFFNLVIFFTPQSI